MRGCGRTGIFFLLFIWSFTCRAQKQASYQQLTAEAAALLAKNQYLPAAKTYQAAFALRGEALFPESYYAARALMSGGDKAAALQQLLIIAQGRHKDSIGDGQSSNSLLMYVSDSVFLPLHSHPSWQEFCCIIEKTRRPLVSTLDSIHIENEQEHQKLNSAIRLCGYGSNEYLAALKSTAASDSANLKRVIAILETRGMPPVTEVGIRGNMTIFMVLLHADSATRKDLLPMLHAAVSNQAAAGSGLALFEDRIRIEEGRPQRYGSQVSLSKTGSLYLYPLEDADSVDAWRVRIHQLPMKYHLRQWNMDWSVAQYRAREPEYAILAREEREEYERWLRSTMALPPIDTTPLPPPLKVSSIQSIEEETNPFTITETVAANAFADSASEAGDSAKAISRSDIPYYIAPGLHLLSSTGVRSADSGQEVSVVQTETITLSSDSISIAPAGEEPAGADTTIPTVNAEKVGDSSTQPSSMTGTVVTDSLTAPIDSLNLQLQKFLGSQAMDSSIPASPTTTTEADSAIRPVSDTADTSIQITGNAATEDTAVQPSPVPGTIEPTADTTSTPTQFPPGSDTTPPTRQEAAQEHALDTTGQQSSAPIGETPPGSKQVDSKGNGTSAPPVTEPAPQASPANP